MDRHVLVDHVSIHQICGAPVCDENTQCAMCASNVINEPECAQCNFTMIAQVTDPDFQLNSE